jgi:hypothetical protein
MKITSKNHGRAAALMFALALAPASLLTVSLGSAQAAETTTGTAKPAALSRVTGVLTYQGPGETYLLQTKDERTVTVRGTKASDAQHAGVLLVGKPYTAYGTYDEAGVLEATAITRAKKKPAAWPADR